MMISANKEFTDGISRFMFSQIELNIPVVSITPRIQFTFNPELLSLKAGGYILVDFCEYGSREWARTETHIFGRNTEHFDYRFPGEEWAKFDQWVKDNPPLLVFKRELLEEDRSDFILPLEYPSMVAALPAAQSREEFNARPLELFHFWGWSHESRRTFHGNAWIHAAQNGIALTDNIQYIQGVVNGPDAKRVWVTTNIPEFARLPLPTIMQANGYAKLSLCLPGAGVKCVRHGESPVNSVMVMQEDNLAWSFPWINTVNCIKVEIGMEPQDLWGLTGKSPEIPVIEDALSRADLYDIYLSGMETCNKYLLRNYMTDYIKPNVLARL